jgi:hypothetical protein
MSLGVLQKATENKEDSFQTNKLYLKVIKCYELSVSLDRIQILY